jgi:hypothetical protein
VQINSHLHPASINSTKSVLLSSDNKLQRPGETAVYGILSERSARIIRALQAAGCTTQLYCQAGQSAMPGDNKDCGGDRGTEFTLCVILYGPRLISEDVGEWLADYELFLQDPVHCDRNVLYHNPHLLCGDDDEPITTFSLRLRVPNIQAETIKVAPNLFEILNQDHHLLETEQPGAVATPLHRSISNYSHRTPLSNE